MGLDCVPLGRAKPGHETEWTNLVQLFDSGKQGEAAIQRFEKISIPAYAVLGAPIVGQHPEADAFMLSRKPKDSAQSDSEYLEQLRGYHAIEMLRDNCDGIPRYSNSGLYAEVDATSFRGAFLDACRNVIDTATIEEAWTTVMSPAQAVAYGRKLLAAAARAKAGELIGGSQKQSLFDRLLGRKPPDIEVLEQIEIIDIAGRWYVFWGGRGHPIWAYF